MELHYRVIGTVLIVLALIHVIFPRYFNWGNELRALSLINRQMMTVHTFFIALTVFLMGVLCLISTNDLIDTRLGRTISLGLGIFWAFRLLIQVFVYSSELWKGKTFETVVHVVFSILWVYISSVFLWSSLS